MAYKVIRRFADLTDKQADFPNGYPYELGDVFPREGHTPSDDFVQGLMTGSNTAGSIFIVVSDDDKDNTPGDTPDNPNDEQDTTELPASEPEKPKRKHSTKAKEV